MQGMFEHFEPLKCLKKLTHREIKLRLSVRETVSPSASLLRWNFSEAASDSEHSAEATVWKLQQQKVNLWWMFSHGRGVKSCRKFISGGYRRAAGRSVSNQTRWRFTENIIIKNCFRMILRWRWEEITPHEAGGGLCGLTVWMYYQYYLLIMLLK